MISDICNFYSNKNIFITGATGLLGKVLIEKYLRACHGLDGIYILMRQKKGKSAKERSDEYISDPIFSLNGLKQSGVCNKIYPIFGDTSQPGFGINDSDRQLLIDRINVVIHVAATVKLHSPLRYAVEHNVRPIISLIELCHQIKQLDCLTYVSTTAILNGTKYCNERIHPLELITPEQVIKACDNCTDKELNKLEKMFFHEFNNTYCISKVLAEQLLHRERDWLRICVVRPSAILTSNAEPEPGWVQGIQGTSSAILAIGIGLMKVFPSRRLGAQVVIPVDFVANAIIAGVWYLTTKSADNIQVYHLTTNSDYSPSMRFIMKLVRQNSLKYPSKRVIRPPYGLVYPKNKLQLFIEIYIKHWIYAYILDFGAKLFGVQTKLLKITNKMNETMKDIRRFMKTCPEYETTNTFALIDQMSVTDRLLFCFDIRQIDWQVYCETMWSGLKRHLLNEGQEDEDVIKAKKILQKVSFKYHILNTCWLIFLSLLLYFIGYLMCDLIGLDYFLPSMSTIVSPSSTMDFVRIVILVVSLVFGYNFFDTIVL
ncbi:fatty acyl-CoA reductase 1-like [Oppia nitens]|uniref:fatty acyl-CoA reductase 1-like n=1 Tax=Oppia nitens TaxID=1686743 RepID=UPI0023DCD4A6|nr:fatty acyl-CoA reductase 1-like [Oppia nitens]